MGKTYKYLKDFSMIHISCVKKFKNITLYADESKR